MCTYLSQEEQELSRGRSLRLDVREHTSLSHREAALGSPGMEGFEQLLQTH